MNKLLGALFCDTDNDFHIVSSFYKEKKQGKKYSLFKVEQSHSHWKSMYDNATTASFFVVGQYKVHC